MATTFTGRFCPFIALVILASLGWAIPEDPKYMQCSVKECDRTGINGKEMMAGRYVCEDFNEYDGVQTMCDYNCYEKTIPDKAEQQKCFCELCKKVGGNGFCAKRKDGWGNLPPIKPDECEEKVCKEYKLVRYRDATACGIDGTEDKEWGPAPPGHDEPDADDCC